MNAQKWSAVLFSVAMVAQLAVIAYALFVDAERMIFEGRYSAIGPIFYAVYSIPAVVLFLISQVISPRRLLIAIYGLTVFAFPIVYVVLKPDFGLD